MDPIKLIFCLGVLIGLCTGQLIFNVDRTGANVEDHGFGDRDFMQKLSKHHPKILLTYYTRQNIDNYKPLHPPILAADNFQKLLLLYLINIATEDNLMNSFNNFRERDEKVVNRKNPFDFFASFRKRVKGNTNTHTQELQNIKSALSPSDLCEICQDFCYEKAHPTNTNALQTDITHLPKENSLDQKTESSALVTTKLENDDNIDPVEKDISQTSDEQKKLHVILSRSNKIETDGSDSITTLKNSATVDESSIKSNISIKRKVTHLENVEVSTAEEKNLIKKSALLENIENPIYVEPKMGKKNTSKKEAKLDGALDSVIKPDAIINLSKNIIKNFTKKDVNEQHSEIMATNLNNSDVDTTIKTKKDIQTENSPRILETEHPSENTKNVTKKDVPHDMSGNSDNEHKNLSKKDVSPHETLQNYTQSTLSLEKEQSKEKKVQKKNAQENNADQGNTIIRLNNPLRRVLIGKIPKDLRLL